MICSLKYYCFYLFLFSLSSIDPNSPKIAIIGRKCFQFREELYLLLLDKRMTHFFPNKITLIIQMKKKSCFPFLSFNLVTNHCIAFNALKTEKYSDFRQNLIEFFSFSLLCFSSVNSSKYFFNTIFQIHFVRIFLQTINTFTQFICLLFATNLKIYCIFGIKNHELIAFDINNLLLYDIIN